MTLERQATPLQRLQDELYVRHEVKVYIKRDDLIHPLVSGNKWRKLKYNLTLARDRKLSAILTFGGAFSNHLYATAAAAREAGLRSIGVVRGEETAGSNPTLDFCRSMGMKLIFIDRTTYRGKHSAAFQQELKDQFGNVMILPEGGTNENAVKGVAEMVDEISIPFDRVFVPTGTGGTLSGISMGIREGQQAEGIAVLKGAEYLEDRVSRLTQRSNWMLHHCYHFGGYARWNETLIRFINKWSHQHRIQLDPIYTGKMVYAVHDLIEKGRIAPGETIILVHTGGLQGIEGFNLRFGSLIEKL